MRFEEYVRSYVAQSINVDYLLDQIQYGLLRDIVEHLLSLPQFKLSRQKRVEITLSVIFSFLVRGFDFLKFLDQMAKNERAQFLSTLLYHIYYINLTLEHLTSPDKLTFYLLRVLASQASPKTILKIFSGLSYLQKMQCIGFCLANFDEGAYRLLTLLEKQGSEEIKKLLWYVRFNLIDKKELGQWLLSQQRITPDTIQELLLACSRDVKERLLRVQAKIKLPLKEVKEALSLFGLYDHQVPKEAWHLSEYPALDEKLAVSTDAQFLRALTEQITSLNHPEYYRKGIDFITFALPTAGKDLSLFPWISSMTEALGFFCDYFKLKNRPAIFVFDQSSKTLFEINRHYIKSLKANIIHLATDEILSLAKRLDLEGLLVTSQEGQFGFGGARNAIFFLAPLLNYYHKRKENFLNISRKQLKKDFREVVLEEKHGPCVIHMGDDDVHIPISNIFGDALFAYKHASEYFCRFGWIIGRRTTWTETTFNIKYVLERSADILLQHGWQESPFSHGMAGLLCKPKLCLNLPFGQEEAYLQSMQQYPFDFRLPAMHLSGYRFPKEPLPLDRYSGLAELLEKHYEYSVGMMLVADLIDPANVQNRCALPWNDKGHTFKNLAEAIHYMLQPKTIKEMQKRFWQNVKLLNHAFKNYKPKEGHIPEQATLHMGILMMQDVQEEKCPPELQKLFVALAKDATLFKKVLENPQGTQKKSLLAFTSALQLLLQAVGSAGFQKKLSLLAKGEGIG